MLLEENKSKEYYIGVLVGLKAFAWWKDGVQYVGTCGTTLESQEKQVIMVMKRSTKE